jgi:polyferredoxin
MVPMSLLMSSTGRGSNPELNFLTVRNESSPEEDLETVEMLIFTLPGFRSLQVLHQTSEEFLYTLMGETTDGFRKRVRYAPGSPGFARLRLQHELSVLQIFQQHGILKVPQPEKVDTLPDRGIYAVYPVTSTKSFQEFTDNIAKMDWWPRLGCILKFAQSFATVLTETHAASIFRITPQVSAES